MNRAAKSGWFVSFMCVTALAVGEIACSTSGNISATSDDSGSTTGAEPSSDDASLVADDGGNDSGADATLDASPTSLLDSTVAEDGTDGDATVVQPLDAAATCKKPAADDPCGLAAGTVCVAAGNALAGHGCTTTASCAPGLTCFNGACRPYCTNTGDAGCDEKLPEGGTCVAIVGEDGGPLPNYDVCTFRCQLQDPKACGPTGDLNSGCVYDNGGTDCEGVGISTIGESCTYLNDCLPGLVCVGECLPWCRVGHTPSDCGDGEACQGFGSPALTANGVEYGYCP
jgi:hypothetical protein